MIKKRKKENQGVSEVEEFRTSPFKNLKGLAVQKEKAPAPEKTPVRDIPTHPPNNDSSLFLKAMKGVVKLAEEKTAPVKESRGKQRPVSEENMEQREIYSKKEPPVNAVETAFFKEEISRLKLDVTFEEKFPEDAEIKPLAHNRLRQLKKGVISVEWQLDLHGLSREEAIAAIPRFLQSARRHGEKGALIITGKGNNSSGEPVLQQAVAGWLRHQGREHILEFAPAPKEMGGSGAFVVFLRANEPR